MQLDIQSHNLDVTDHLKKYTENEMSQIFSKLNKNITKIDIRLYEIKDVSKYKKIICQMQIHTHCLPTIFTESQSKNVYTVIDKGLRKARKQVSNKLTRFETLLTKLKSLKKRKYSTTTLKLPYHHQLTREFS